MIEKVRLENIKSYEFVEVTFPDGITAIAGPNGAGKSTIIEAVGFALFGSQRVKQDLLLRHHAKHGSVEVTFHSPATGESHVVRREIERGSGSTATLWRADSPQAVVQGVREVQEEIAVLLGLPDSLPAATFWEGIMAVPQGQLTTDFTLTPTPRKARFEELLGLESYDKIWKALADPVNRAKDSLAELRGDLKAERRVLEAKPEAERAVDKFREDAEVYSESLNNARAVVRRLESQLASIESAKAALEDAKAALLARDGDRILAQSKLDAIVDRIEALRDAEYAVEAYKEGAERYEALEAEINEIDVPAPSGREAQLKERLKAYKDRLDVAMKDERTALKAVEVMKENQADSDLLEERQDDDTKLRERWSALHSRILDFEKRAETLREADDEAACPTCGAPLTKGHRDGLLDGMDSDIKALEAEIRSVEEDGTEAHELLRKSKIAHERWVAAHQVAKGLPDIQERKDSGRGAVAKVEKELELAGQEERGRELLEFLFHDLTTQREEVREAYREYTTAQAILDASGNLREKRSEAEKEVDQAQIAFEEADGRVIDAKANYVESLHKQVAEQLSGNQQLVSSLRAKVDAAEQALDSAQHRLDDMIAAEERADALETECASLDRHIDLLSGLREEIRALGPQIAAALRERVGRRASDIYRELGAESATLEWTDDYGILIRRNGNETEFGSLSGGEQMSAALAVRLALLAEMSETGVAVFDEPTINLDERHRAELAEQLGNIRSVSQMLVVSHDDTFEAATENVVHIVKHGDRSTIA